MTATEFLHKHDYELPYNESIFKDADNTLEEEFTAEDMVIFAEAYHQHEFDYGAKVLAQAVVNEAKAEQEIKRLETTLLVLTVDCQQEIKELKELLIFAKPQFSPKKEMDEWYSRKEQALK